VWCQRRGRAEAAREGDPRDRGDQEFDGKVAHEGTSAEPMFVVDTPPVDLPPDTGVPARLVIDCFAPDRDAISDKALTKACAAFRKTVALVE
jgi:hypothetical protein